MARNVTNAAWLLRALCAPEYEQDFVSHLNSDCLRGIRLGFSTKLVESLMKWSGPPAEPVFQEAQALLRKLGAEIVDVQFMQPEVFLDRTYMDKTWPTELKDGLENYFESVGCAFYGVTA